MKVKVDVESLLRQAPPEPMRPLSIDFTQEVIRRLDQAERKSGVADKLWSLLKIKKLAPLSLGLIALVSIGTAGTVYATLQGWPNITAFFSGETREPAGSRIVKVDTTNCSSLDVPLVFQYVYHKDESVSRYFRIKQDSKLTNEEVVRMVQGYCELGKQTQFDQTTIMPEVTKKEANKDAQIFGFFASSKVERIGRDHITVKADVPAYTATDEMKSIRYSFNAIDPDVLVYDIDRKISINDIRVGDNIALKYRISKSSHQPQEVSPDNISTADKIIVSITRNPSQIVAAFDYMKHKKDLIEVTPCSTHSSGYCTAEEFAPENH